MFAHQHTLFANRITRERDGVRLKTIALPAEHGGWGLLFEPLVLGLLLAPSAGGLYLALSAVGFFLARHPLTLLVTGRRRASPRTALAKRFAALYLAIGGAAFAAAIIFSRPWFVVPLLLAMPLGIVQLKYDWTGRRRALLSEIAGAAAVASLAAAIALCGGWPAAAAFALWAIMIARAVPAILYVRTYLARRHSRASSALPMLFAHIIGIIGVAILASSGFAPRLAVVAMIVLLVRAVITLNALQVTAKQLGFSEIAFGAVTTFMVILGKGLQF